MIGIVSAVLGSVVYRHHHRARAALQSDERELAQAALGAHRRGDARCTGSGRSDPCSAARERRTAYADAQTARQDLRRRHGERTSRAVRYRSHASGRRVRHGHRLERRGQVHAVRRGPPAAFSWTGDALCSTARTSPTCPNTSAQSALRVSFRTRCAGNSARSDAGGKRGARVCKSRRTPFRTGAAAQKARVLPRAARTARHGSWRTA